MPMARARTGNLTQVLQFQPPPLSYILAKMMPLDSPVFLTQQMMPIVDSCDMFDSRNGLQHVQGRWAHCVRLPNIHTDRASLVSDWVRSRAQVDTSAFSHDTFAMQE